MTQAADNSGKRLNKYISDSGYCSRREADRLIEQFRVTINGKKPELGTKVMPSDEVQVDGKAIMAVAEDKTDRIYIAYNKPIGITCTTESRVQGNIVEAINHPQRIFPIGRLDKPSEGLIFLTSDGDIVNKILRAENAHDKEYVVTVDKPLNESFVQRMSNGIPILDTVTKPCKVTLNSKYVFTIILTQGLNRQIRRMAEYLGYEVTKLKRTRIMNVHLGKLKPGQWRNLTAKEMAEINDAVAGSTKTASHSTTKNSAKKPATKSAHRKTQPENRNRRQDERNSKNSRNTKSGQRHNSSAKKPSRNSSDQKRRGFSKK